MDDKKHACDDCRFRKKAEARPESLLARLWKWHTRWCPGWKSYQKWLTEQARSEPGRV